MASLRQIRRRIRSVKSTQQITRAMEMVSASKLKRSGAMLFSNRPYAKRMARLLMDLAHSTCEYVHPLFEKREVQNIGVVIVTTDKGLCGSYNSNIIKTAETFLKRQGRNKIRLILIGKKAQEHFKKKEWEIVHVVQDSGGKIDNARTEYITGFITDIFLKGEVDEVYLVYTTFGSALVYKPTVEKFLNIEMDSHASHESQPPEKFHEIEYIFEPNPKEILDVLMPRYTFTKMHIVLAEAWTSEHSARMIAMKSATDNAEEMVDHLTLVRNKLRQASITKEISEIVAGAEALK